MVDNNVSDNKIVMYRGKRIEDMSREELIDALNFAANEIQRLLAEKHYERDFFGNVYTPLRVTHTVKPQ